MDGCIICKGCGVAIHQYDTLQGLCMTCIDIRLSSIDELEEEIKSLRCSRCESSCSGCPWGYTVIDGAESIKEVK